MILSKRGFMIAIPIWAVMVAYIWFVPLHNLLNMPETVLTDSELIPYTNFNNKTIAVYPIFTGYAYSKNGFYSYYNHTCDTQCLTVTISRNGSNYEKLTTDIESVYWIHPQTETSNSAYHMLTKLNYHWITDIDIDKNPKILDRYNKVILLHNEYVTEKEYSAIKHKQTIYLYPNALYAEIKVNYASNTMTLMKGHSYKGINNAFNSGTTNKGEHDYKCKTKFWHKVQNGIMLSCYPELDILTDKQLLQMIQVWPNTESFNSTSK